MQYLTVANPADRKPSPSRPESLRPVLASIYITISSTSYPSRFDHSPISSRDHERAYFVLEIQMVPHFFFFATNGLPGAIDPIDGGTKELLNSPSPSHFWFIKIGWIAAHLHFFHSLPSKRRLRAIWLESRSALARTSSELLAFFF